MQSDSIPVQHADPFQVRLEGISSPFVVTVDESVGTMMVGELGPQPSFDPGIRVDAMTVPDQVRFEPVATVDDHPELARIDVASTVYVGRVPGTSIDVFVFSTEPWDEPLVAVYAFEGSHHVELAYRRRRTAPGYSRMSRFDVNTKDSDVLWWGPLDPGASLVTLSAEGELLAAVRPRARFVMFDMTDTPRWAPLQLAAYDAQGAVIAQVDLEGQDPREAFEAP